MLVDVNKTGMWNEEIRLDYTNNIIISRQEKAFYCEPVLFIFDSEGVHVILFAKSKVLETINIFYLLVLPKTTSIMQTLDVAVNRSIQAFYQRCYVRFICEDLELKCKQAGKTKFMEVSRWTLCCITTLKKEAICNAFKK
jgi:hypothetical protein